MMSFDISNRSPLRPDLHAAVSQDWMNEQQTKEWNEDALLSLLALKCYCVIFIQGQFRNCNQQTEEVYRPEMKPQSLSLLLS